MSRKHPTREELQEKRQNIKKEYELHGKVVQPFDTILAALKVAHRQRPCDQKACAFYKGGS